MMKRIFAALINFKTEPVRAVARITSAITVTISLLALWGVDMSNETQTALIATATTIVPVIIGAAEFMRQFVTPVPVAHEAIKDALAGPVIVATPRDMNALAKATLKDARQELT